MTDSTTWGAGKHHPTPPPQPPTIDERLINLEQRLDSIDKHLAAILTDLRNLIPPNTPAYIGRNKP